MQMKKICLLASFVLFSTSAVFAQLAVSYGEGSGKVDYTNTNKYAEIEEPLPFGPLSFRVVGDKTWIADSVGGKLMQYDRSGKLLSEFSVLPAGVKPYELDPEGFPNPNVLIEDIAPVIGQYGDIEAWWVADSDDNKLLKFSSDGKILAQLQDPDYGQLFRIEVGAGGHLFVADKGSRKIYVYDSKGDYVNAFNWEWSGMAVTGKEDNLYRLIYFNEEKRNMLVKTDLKGNVIKSKAVEIEMSDPELWWVDEAKGEAVITYTPLEGFEGDYNIIRVNLDGKVIASGKLPAPFVMNRFIDHADFEEFFIGKANYSEAPEGSFEIVPFKMP